MSGWRAPVRYRGVWQRSVPAGLVLAAEWIGLPHLAQRPVCWPWPDPGTCHGLFSLTPADAADVTGGQTRVSPTQTPPITPIGAEVLCWPGSVKGDLPLDGFWSAWNPLHGGVVGDRSRFQPSRRASPAGTAGPGRLTPEKVEGQRLNRADPRTAT